MSLSVAGAAHADWPSDPLVNLPVCTATGAQSVPRAIPDGAGGMIVTWQDTRSGSHNDIYAQRVLASGSVDPAWPANGVAVCTATGDQNNPKLVPDGAGGAIIAWHDARFGVSTKVYAHHLLASGVVDASWPANGLLLCTDAGGQLFPVLAPNGAGGAIAAWQDDRYSYLGQGSVFAQFVTADAVADTLWPADGLDVAAPDLVANSPAIVEDGVGGAFVAWTAGGGAAADIHMRRVLPNAEFDPAWPADGLVVCAAANAQNSPRLIADGLGGAVVAWQDSRDDAADVYAQHVLASGVVDPAWPADGRALCTAAAAQTGVAIASDGAGGAIVGWQDLRGGATNDIYACRVRFDGSLDPAWPSDGRAICAAAGNQINAFLVADGANGALLAWQDPRSGSSDIFAARVLADGTLHDDWPVDGAALCTASGGQFNPTIVTDEHAGALVAWQDARGGANDIYAQRVLANGLLGGSVTGVTTSAGHGLLPLAAWPNPARGGVVTVRFTLGGGAPASMSLFDAGGRAVATRDVTFLGPGTHSLQLSGATRLSPGIYFLRLSESAHVRVTRLAVFQ